jgi:predicted membrane-bound spermidine synthase
VCRSKTEAVSHDLTFSGHPIMKRSLLLNCLQVRITAVDIDPAMLQVATEYFNLVQDERLDVYIRDGVHFIQQAAEKGLTISSALEPQFKVFPHLMFSFVDPE